MNVAIFRQLGVRSRLLVAFLGISALAMFAAGASLYVFDQLGSVLERITERRVPDSVASLELSRQADRIVAAAPALLAVTKKSDHERVSASIAADVGQLERLLDNLRRGALDPATLASLEPAVQGLRDNLEQLDALVAGRIEVADGKEALLRRLTGSVTAAQRVTRPGILVLDSIIATDRRDRAQDRSETSTEATEAASTIISLVPLQKVQLELSAINDALIRAASASRSDLNLVSFPLERSFTSLEQLQPLLDEKARGRLVKPIAELRALAEGNASILRARADELDLIVKGEKLIAENAALSRQLTIAVDRLVAAAANDIEGAMGEAASVQTLGRAVLLAVMVLSLLSSVLIVWRYVDRRLVARLTALSDSMLAIAGGNLQAPLPPVGDDDEIGKMARALTVFRDTAVEVRDQNLRERQVVLDTIEYGVLILDPELKVRMHNRAFRKLWGLTKDSLRQRRSIRELLESLRVLGMRGVSDSGWQSFVERSIAEIQAGSGPPQEWVRHDGKVLQYEIAALPNGGRMLAFFDLTHLKGVETELRTAKEQAERRTQELVQSLAELKTAQNRLIQTEKLASLGQLTAGIAHEIKNPLNFINNFSAVSGEVIVELRQILEKVALPAKLREEIDELAEMLKGNLEKVVQHGKRADSIVKNMLLHSRQGSGEHWPVDINAIVEESLNLAYHGARAEKKGFTITLEKSLDPDAGQIDLYPQEITRVLLNLISNGFYATTKRSAEMNGATYDPVLAATTRNLGDSVEIRIRDNGTGIPPEVKEKMFNPFFTTKPAGEGTGLGLSLSHDIIVKQHAGTIEVDTEPGAFTEFRIILPRGAATLAKSGGQA